MLNLPMDHIGLHCSDVELNAKMVSGRIRI